jgi:hypothetical protein
VPAALARSRNSGGFGAPAVVSRNAKGSVLGKPPAARNSWGARTGLLALRLTGKSPATAQERIQRTSWDFFESDTGKAVAVPSRRAVFSFDAKM